MTGDEAAAAPRGLDPPMSSGLCFVSKRPHPIRHHSRRPHRRGIISSFTFSSIITGGPEPKIQTFRASGSATATPQFFLATSTCLTRSWTSCSALRSGTSLSLFYEIMESIILEATRDTHWQPWRGGLGVWVCLALEYLGSHA